MKIRNTLCAAILGASVALTNTAAAGTNTTLDEWRWQPTLWMVKPTTTPISIVIVDVADWADFKVRNGIPATAAGYARVKGAACTVYLSTDTVFLAQHEIRHCQEGAWHAAVTFGDLLRGAPQ